MRREVIAAELLAVFLILAVIVDYVNRCLIFPNLLLTLSPLYAIYLVLPTASLAKTVPTFLSLIFRQGSGI